MHYPYVIIGGGLTSASAIRGIRSKDPTGSILLVSRENHAPYDRPALSKGLWFGKTTPDKLPLHDDAFYREQHVDVVLRREIMELIPEDHLVTDDRGESYEYDKLLIATGGRPRMLGATNANLEGIHYFRSLEDYLALARRVRSLQHVLVIGGGFIGTELAAALRHAGLEVTWIYPHEYPLSRVLPRDLGLFVADYYRDRGIETVSGDAVMSFTAEASGPGLIDAETRLGNTVTTQAVVAGVGMEPNVELAEAAGLEVGNGIQVDEYARTSDASIFAAGDVAEFPYLALGERTRIEHWNHARLHGRAAGANMAGANEPYEKLPMFYSDLFDLGWEAVGDVDPGLEVHPVWKEENREGVIFYLRDDVIRGVLLWNVWKKLEWARGLILSARPTTAEEREKLVTAEG